MKESKRLKFLILFLFFLFGILIVRVVYLTFFNDKIPKNHYTKKIRRGSIYDRKGVELAYSKDSHTVGIDTKNIYDIYFTSKKLSEVLNIEIEKIEELIDSKKGYFLLKREIDDVIALKIRQMRLPGVRLESELKRIYPQGRLASNVVGFTGLDDNRALAGIEYYYKDYLLRDNLSNGRGDDLYLTLDSQVQKSFELILGKAFVESASKKAVGILMKIDTAEIIAMSNFPNFDPNFYGEFKQDSKTNWAIRHLYEPGSTMKLFVLAAVLNEGLVKPKDRFFCPGFSKIGNSKIRCTGVHGDITFEEVVIKSCNYGTIEVVKRISHEKLYEYLVKFGFGQKTSILPNEKGGYLPPLKEWVKSTPYFTSIGYGLSVTPIQLVKAVSILLNYGDSLVPQIAMHTRDSLNNQVNHKFKNGYSKNLQLKKQTVEAMKNLMRRVVLEGTGIRARSKEYHIAGKTGTAQKFAPGVGYRGSGLFSTSFLGFYPFEKPEYVSIVLFDQPDPEKHLGGKLAAPIFVKVAESVLSKSQEVRLVPNYKLNSIKVQKPEIANLGKIPSFLGKSKRQVINIFSEYSNDFEMEGHGFCYKQEPKAGLDNKNQKVKLYFR